MTNRNPQDPQKPARPFDLEDKSLASTPGIEVKDAGPADAPADEVDAAAAEDDTPAPADAVRVKMTHHGDLDGKPLIPGKEYPLPRRLADALVADHRAVPAKS